MSRPGLGTQKHRVRLDQDFKKHVPLRDIRLCIQHPRCSSNNNCDKIYLNERESRTQVNSYFLLKIFLISLIFHSTCFKHRSVFRVCIGLSTTLGQSNKLLVPRCRSCGELSTSSADPNIKPSPCTEEAERKTTKLIRQFPVKNPM